MDLSDTELGPMAGRFNRDKEVPRKSDNALTSSSDTMLVKKKLSQNRNIKNINTLGNVKRHLI